MSKKIKLIIVSLLLITACCFTMFGCANMPVFYTVNFNSNGGTAIESVEVFKGETAQKPADPTKTGYVFAGWYLGETEFSFESSINANTTLDAKWSPATDTAYTVKHLLEKLDGTGYEEVAEDAETLQGTTDALTNAEANEYDGFTAKAINQVTIAPDGSTVVEVKYDRNLIAITWMINGVSVERSCKYGAVPSYDGTPTKQADNVYTYEFSGWAEEILPATEPATYTAEFTSTYINYTVVFKTESGEVISSKNDYHYGDTIVVPADQTKPADNVYTYTFNGWNVAESVNGNLEYVASFTPVYINYTVEFKSINGETILSKTDYHYGDTVVVPDHVNVHPGYEYGWDAEVVAVAGNAVYNETRSPKTFAVALETNGANEGSSLASYVYGEGATLPTDLTKVGHDFAGWYASEDFSGEAVTAIGVEEYGDKEYFAKWTAKTYNVTLNAGTGEVVGALTQYTYGVGATLPECTKKGYDFVGWYASEDFAGEAISEISTTDLEDKAFYAKYEARNDTKYSVQVLVAQYTSGSDGGYYCVKESSLTYVDATQAFASVFGLDENNKAQGITDSTIDLTAVVNALDGAKLNAGSVLSGVIDADETLELIVKLDVDEDELGFKLADIMFGQWSCNNLLYTLDYYAGVCGLLIEGDVGNGKELFIEIDTLLVANYAAINFIYYEKSQVTGTYILASATKTALNNSATGHDKLFNAVNEPSDFVNGCVNLMKKFPAVNSIKQINLKFSAPGNVNTGKKIFLGGIKPVEFVQEDATYSAENGNLFDIASPISTSTITKVDSYTFGDETAPALHYQYDGVAINDDRMAGIVFDLGGIIVSDYKTIKIVLKSSLTSAIWLDGTYVNWKGANETTIDLKAEAEAKNISIFNKLEIVSAKNVGNATHFDLYVAYIVLELDENAPARNFLYSVELEANGGTLDSSLTTYEHTVGATLPTASKTGYTFAGWYENADLSGEAVTAISPSDAGNKAYYAKWQANSYNVSFNLDGGSLESELTSYVYGEGATLPTASKPGYAFAGWYANEDLSGDPVTEISASDLGDKEFYAKWEVGKANYSVQILVAKYGFTSNSGVYTPSGLSYVDATSELASVLGLDGELKGTTGETVNISDLIPNLKGAKVNEGSELSGEILADGSLELIVKLDFDSEELGFNVEEMAFGTWNVNDMSFMLKYYDGKFGVEVDIDFASGNGKELTLNVGEIVLENYEAVFFTYYEKSATTNTQISASSEVKAPLTGYGFTQFIPNTVNPSKYIKATVNLADNYASVGTVKQIVLKYFTPCEKIFFIPAIEKVTETTRKEVTYSIANGNLLSVATGLNGEQIGQVANQGSLGSAALHYHYEGETITTDHTAGIVFDLGYIKVSDYKTITIKYVSQNAGNNGTKIHINGKSSDTNWGGAQTVDIKKFAEDNGITVFNKIELSSYSGVGSAKADIYVAEIILELKEILCSICGSTEEAHAVCEFCSNYVCVGDHSECKPVLCPACGSKEEAHAVCEFCSNYVCVGDHSNCKIYNVTLVLNGGSVEEDLTSYAYGVGATLPVPTQEGYTFVGWYTTEDLTGEPVSEISASDLGDKTFYAKWEVSQANYSVQILVAQYGCAYVSGCYYPSGLSYVDATSELAGVLGLDGELKGLVGETVDVSAAVANLKGAKVNADSVLSGEIYADGSLELIVKLDFDSKELGFNVEDMKFGRYEVTMASTSFTLKYHDGAFGVEARVMIEKNNGKELSLPINEIVLENYTVAKLHYYEMSSTTNTQVGVSSEVIDIATSGLYASQQNLGFTSILYATNPTEYKKYTVDFIKDYSSVGTVKQVVFKYSNPCEKIFFIAGIEKVPYIKENGIYNVENGKLASIATPVAGTLTTADYNFNNGSVPALYYYYEGETITADHMASIVFDFGGTIKVSDYKSIKITYYALKSAANVNTVLYLDNKYVGWGGGGTNTIDLIEKAKGASTPLTEFSKFELTIDKNANDTIAKIYVESIVFELNPESVTYSIANGNMQALIQPVSNGTLSYVNHSNWADTTIGEINTIKYVGNHDEGITFILPYPVRVADYKTIKIDVYSLNANGINVYVDGINVTGAWGAGGKTLDVISLIKNDGKGKPEYFQTIQIVGKAESTDYQLIVAQIVFEVAD